MPRLRTLLGSVVVVAAAGCAGAAAYAWHPAIPPVEPPAATSFPPDLVRRGETLAAIGNCAGCHSAPDASAYSGGVPIVTPFGTVYGSNLTPDPDTGIGRWSEVAFRRAMREGLDRDGRHLYPAFPYTHFTHVTDDDDRALYAYLMTRAPAARQTPAPQMIPPLGFRPLLAGWDLLFFRSDDGGATGADDPVMHRGAYLVEGLGHCGACHTPRNAFGAERADQYLAGGEAEGWNAYPLNAASPAPIPWTPEALAFYLAHGWQVEHGVSRGPMANVTAGLAAVPRADVDAMAAYLVDLMGSNRAPRGTTAEPSRASPPSASAGSQVAVADTSADAGAAIYAGACASCHESGRPVPFGGLPLALSSALHAPDPTNIVTVTLHGLRAPPGEAGAIMPGFDGTLSDAQIAALLAYMRDAVAHEPAWPDLGGTVRKARTQAVTLFPSDGVSAAPPDTDIRVAP